MLRGPFSPKLLTVVGHHGEAAVLGINQAQFGTTQPPANIDVVADDADKTAATQNYFSGFSESLAIYQEDICVDLVRLSADIHCFCVEFRGVIAFLRAVVVFFKIYKFLPDVRLNRAHFTHRSIQQAFEAGSREIEQYFGVNLITDLSRVFK